MLELDNRNLPDLLHLRQTVNVQRLVAQQFARTDWSPANYQGCQIAEDWLQLHGWARRRRVVIVRLRLRGGIARERRVDGKQFQLDLAGHEVLECERLWDFAVMVTDVKSPMKAIGQLYRDRADCENGFVELKNQWSLSGFTTQNINRCQTEARARALAYNWWSRYYITADTCASMEAITSRPLLLAAVGTVANHADQTTLHGSANMLKPLIANIREALQHVKDIAEQFKVIDRRAVLLQYVSAKIAPALGPFRPPDMLPATG